MIDLLAALGRRRDPLRFSVRCLYPDKPSHGMTQTRNRPCPPAPQEREGPDHEVKRVSGVTR
jgi:hypothetical protein